MILFLLVDIYKLVSLIPRFILSFWVF